MFAIFLMAFFLGDWVYTFKNNENVMYYYFVSYPLGMKLIETSIHQTEDLLSPFIDIIPK